MIGAGNALAGGQVGSANAWGNAMSSGVNQLSNAYGQYRGQQNFNNWMGAQNNWNNYRNSGGGNFNDWNAAVDQAGFSPTGAVYTGG
jgi:hypothetical protein